MRWLLLALTACTAQAGTIDVSLTTAPGSHVLDTAQTLRLVLTNPHQVTTAQRTASGFSIALDLPAEGTNAQVIVDALDASGAIVATGTSPPFPIGAITAQIAIYMAPPMSIAAAPVTLEPARSELATASLPYGAMLLGGRDASGAPSDAIAIYNAYTHALVPMVPLPAPRAGAIAMTTSANNVFVLGGTEPAGAASGSLWELSTTTGTMGAFIDLGDKADFARADQIAVPLGTDRFLISGTPAAELDAVSGQLVKRTEVATLPPAGASVIATDGTPTAIFAGAEIGGLVRFRRDAFSEHTDLPDAARTGHGLVALPGGTLGLFCGGAAGLRIDPVTETVTQVPGTPAKTGCAIAATEQYLLIASGDTADVFDAATLAPVASLPLVVPRTGATATALANGQILIAGGLDGSGKPIDTLELFTPPSAESF